MKLIIAGTRGVTPTLGDIGCYLEHFNLNPTEIVSGCCLHSPDDSGSRYAFAKGIKTSHFPFKKGMGKGGGPARNREMAKHADALLLIWDGQSRGSKNMKEEMVKLCKPVYEIGPEIYLWRQNVNENNGLDLKRSVATVLQHMEKGHAKS